MKTFVTSLLVVSLGLVSSVSAQETNQEILDRIANKVATYSGSVADQQQKVSVPVVNQNVATPLSDLQVVQRQLISQPVIAVDKRNTSSQVEIGGIEVLGDQNLMMPLRELPSGSRFTFSKSMFFPANTIALLYVNGSPSGKVYEGGEPLDNILNTTELHHSACVMTTDKSYIKFRGADTSVTPTFIDFDKIEYIKDGDSNRVIYKLVFKGKPAGTHTINIEMACVLPVEKNNDVPSLQMSHIIDSFGKSFTFEPPKYVEL